MISVIIVSYNSAPLTKRAVDSVLREGEASEIFVVDNTATEDERSTLRSGLDRDIRIIFNERNEGFGRACNTAYAKSKGEWIFLLNPDAYVLPGALTVLKRFLLENPRAGAVGPRIFWDSEKTFFLPPSLFHSPAGELCRQANRLSGAFTSVRSLSSRRRSVLAWTSSSPLRQNALSGGHVMLRRSAIETCGGLFDDAYFMYFEDSDLMLRLRRAGWGLFMEPKAEVIHSYVHEEGKMRLIEKSAYHYYSKNYGKSFILKAAAMMSALPLRRAACLINVREFVGPLKVRVPDKYQQRWLFEWSPSPDLIPSVGNFGSGPEFIFPEKLWGLIEPGTYYARISAARPTVFSASWLCWKKAEA